MFEEKGVDPIEKAVKGWEEGMYLHLGQDVVVQSKEVIGIFDLENTSTSRFTKEFLRRANQEIDVVTVSYEMPKSLILCGRRGKLTLYISQISTATLKKRSGPVAGLDKRGGAPPTADAVHKQSK